MIKLIFAIYDSKSGLYSEIPIFQFKSIGDAKRGFSDLVNDVKKDNQIAMHPEDFSLMYLGEYNCSTGVFTNVDVPQNLGLASSFKVTSISNNMSVVGGV